MPYKLRGKYRNNYNAYVKSYLFRQLYVIGDSVTGTLKNFDNCS